uniref:TF-B3 domain-containing protein n=1 Tax=Arundo donax TaxID=35708 RepID=A0A0A9D3Q3_ARUDO
MMFRYTGDSQFHVIIFDQFGCEEPLSVLEDYACLPPRDPERHIDATGTMKCCQNCKALDEYKYHSFDNEEKYFLVSVKGDFRYEMTVPEEYVRCFRGEFPGEIKLETRNGYSYTVGVAKYPDKVIFSAGWEAFVRAYDLHMDDSMVFRYIENSWFNVIIFSHVGCEKASAVVVNSATVPLHALKRCRDSTETVNCAHDHPGTIQMGSLPRQRGTWLHTDSSNQGNKTRPNFPATPDSSGQPLFSEDDVLQVPPQLRYIVAKKSHLRDNQKKKVEETVQCIYFGIPIFVIVICESNIGGKFQLNLPKQYTKRYLDQKERVVFLERGGQSMKRS